MYTFSEKLNHFIREKNSLSTRVAFWLFNLVCFSFVLRLCCAGTSLILQSNTYFKYDLMLNVFQRNTNYDSLVYYLIAIMFLFTYSTHYFLYVYSDLKLWSHFLNDLVYVNHKSFVEGNYELIQDITWNGLLASPRKTYRETFDLNRSLWNYPHNQKISFGNKLQHFPLMHKQIRARLIVYLFFTNRVSKYLLIIASKNSLFI